MRRGCQRNVYFYPVQKVMVQKVMLIFSCSAVSDSFVIPWTLACQAALSREFCGQEYWSGCPFPSPEALPDPGIKPGSPALQAESLPSEPPGKVGGERDDRG